MKPNTSNPTTHEAPKAHTCEADRIPVGNEMPFSTSIDDLYLNLMGMREALLFFGEDVLQVIHKGKHPASDAMHTTFTALMGHFCTLLKELRFAAEIAKVRGWNHIANDAWLNTYDPARRSAGK